MKRIRVFIIEKSLKLMNYDFWSRIKSWTQTHTHLEKLIELKLMKKFWSLLWVPKEEILFPSWSKSTLLFLEVNLLMSKLNDIRRFICHLSTQEAWLKSKIIPILITLKWRMFMDLRSQLILPINHINDILYFQIEMLVLMMEEGQTRNWHESCTIMS